MSLISRKIAAFAKKVANLSPKPGGTMPVADLQAQFDAAPEELRAALNGALDDIIADYATKAELSGIQLGQISDGTVTPAKLSFDVATQAELNAVLNNGAVFTGGITINKPDPFIIFKSQDAGHTNEQIKATHFSGSFELQDFGASGTYVKSLFKIDRSTGVAYLGNNIISVMAAGSYTGTGISRTISLGFTPKYAIITGQRSGGTASLTAFHITPSRAISTYGTEHTLIKCVTNGIQLNDGDFANVNATTYDYVVWG